MAYEGTRVPVSQTQGEIRRLVLKNGGTGIAFFTQTEPHREGFEALVPVDGVTYQVRIIAKLKERNSQKAREQEERRVWRVLYFHLKAVYEAAATGVLEFRELVLPYIVTHGNQTIAQRILPQLDKVVNSNVRLLPAGPGEAK